MNSLRLGIGSPLVWLVLGGAALGACSVVNSADDPEAPGTGGEAATTNTGGSGGTGAGGSGGSGGNPVVCGDGDVGGDEACDDGGESPTCNDDCTIATCGDQTLNASAGEECDDGGETDECDADCTTAICGDDTVNATRGEQCDDANDAAVGCCDAACQFTQNCGAPSDIALQDQGGGLFSGASGCTIGGTGEVPSGPCDGDVMGEGPEHVFRFDLATPSSVEIRVSSDFDAIVRLMTVACDLDAEIPESGPGSDGCANAFGPGNEELLSYSALGPGTYFVVVDGAGADDSGAFSVTVDANELDNPILNPSFESGDYSSWTLLQTDGGNPDYTVMTVLPATTIDGATPYVDYFDGGSYSTSSPLFPFAVAPTEGGQVAVWLSNGPANRRMYQDVLVTSATLTWDMAHWNADPAWGPAQYIAINVRDPSTDAVLATPFTANALPVVVPSMTPRTADLSAFVGQVVRIDVEIEGQNFYLDAAFDNFVIQ